MENANVPTRLNATTFWQICQMNDWEGTVIILTVFIVFYSLICLFGMFGSGLVIFITGFRMKKTFTTVFFLNLAIADFFATFFLPVMIVFLFGKVDFTRLSQLFGKEMCQFFSTIKLLNLYSSVFFLMVISLGRYISVRYPVWARNHQTPRLASLVALVIWILSLGLSCAYLYTDRNWRFGPLTLSESIHFCFGGYDNLYIDMNYHSLSFFLSHVTLSFILPFIFMISCYGATILQLRRSQFAQSGKPFKAITAVTMAFFICWFPLNVLNCIEIHWMTCKQYKVLYTTHNISGWLAYSNSCLNPILYVFIGQHYRESLRCSFLSALENAFCEENSPGRTTSKDKSPAMAESQNL